MPNYPKTLFCINADPEAYAMHRFQEEAQKRGLRFVNWPLKKLFLKIEKSRLFLSDEDGTIWSEDQMFGQSVIFRDTLYKTRELIDMDWRNCLIDYLNELNCKIVNHDCLKKFPKFEDKFIQSLFFSKLGLPFPYPTLSLNSKSALNTYVKKLKFPLLIKPRYGSQGRNIERVNSSAELLNLFEYFKVSDFIFQPFIENDFDVRIITTKTEIIGAMKKTRSSGIANNVSLGAKVENFNLKKGSKLEAQCLRICNELDADYVGVDVLFDQLGNYYFLEVNRHCEFKAFEAITGINFAEKVVRMAVNF